MHTTNETGILKCNLKKTRVPLVATDDTRVADGRTLACAIFVVTTFLRLTTTDDLVTVPFGVVDNASTSASSINCKQLPYHHHRTSRTCFK
jgi:hypothetical protein